MANSGIEIYNDNNILTINNTFKNLSLVRKVQLKDFTYVQGQTVYKTLPLRDNEYLPIAKNGVTYCSSGTIINTIIKEAGMERTIFAVGDEEAYVYIYGFEGSDCSKYTYGLQVFDNENNCVFDSNKSYLKVLAVIENRNFTGEDSFNVYTDPKNKTIGYCILRDEAEIGYVGTRSGDYNIPFGSSNLICECEGNKLNAYKLPVAMSMASLSFYADLFADSWKFVGVNNGKILVVDMTGV